MALTRPNFLSSVVLLALDGVFESIVGFRYFFEVVLVNSLVNVGMKHFSELEIGNFELTVVS